jgi:hypothetical protein
MPVVEDPRIEPVEVLHATSEVPLGSLDQEVDMVRHQAVSQKPPLLRSRDAAKKRQIEPVIPLIAKDFLTAVSTRINVLKQSRRVLSKWPRHTTESRGPPKFTPQI